MNQLFRLAPSGKPSQYKTYQILAPTATHWRKAKCREVGCDGYEVSCPNCTRGWVTQVDESTELGKNQAYYIRKNSGRTFKESRSGMLTMFQFEGHQKCFTDHPVHEHRIRLDRPFVHLIKGGDYRGNPMGIKPREVAYNEWTDDFAENQDNLSTEEKKGAY